MRGRIFNIFFLVSVIVAVGVSIWGPEALSDYRDRSLLGTIHEQQVESGEEGYRYQLSPAEKLYVLSRALESQAAAESEWGLKGQGQETWQQESGGSYAFVVNHRGLSEDVSYEEMNEAVNQALSDLKEAGILPESVQRVEPELYEAELYSAIDVREPRNSATVWRLTLSQSQRGLLKENRLMEAYMDADDGKIYEFYARTERKWEDMDPDTLVSSWCQYLGLPKPRAFESSGILSEATPFFRKYVVQGNGEERTIVTVGFYEGIQEIFIRITQ